MMDEGPASTVDRMPKKESTLTNDLNDQRRYHPTSHYGLTPYYHNFKGLLA